MIWLVIIISGMITFAMRFVFLTPLMPKDISPAMTTAMRLVPIAVLWTIIVAEIFLSGQAVADPLTNPRLYAAALALIVAWLSQSVIATIGVGLPALWAFDYFLS